MSINAADLPIEVRRKLGIQANPRTTSRVGPHDPSEASSWRCECGRASSKWAPLQAHANAEHHTRIEVVL